MTRFLLTGFSAELSLRPLARELEARGLPVALVDLAEDGPALAPPPGDGPLVLITSQHTLLTGPAYDDFYALRSRYAAPQAIRAAVRADLAVFVPHDLLEPVLPAEVPLLQTFDLFAAPDATWWWAAAHVETVVTGWIGAMPPEADHASVPADRGVLFVAATRWLQGRGGGPFLVRALERTLELGLAAKLPPWPGYEPIERALTDAGVPLLAPELNATEVARRAPLIVANGPTSVLAEANLAGHRPLCVLHPEHDEAFSGHLASLDVVVCRDDEAPARVAEAGRVRTADPGFDVDALLAAVSRRIG